MLRILDKTKQNKIDYITSTESTTFKIGFSDLPTKFNEFMEKEYITYLENRIEKLEKDFSTAYKQSSHALNKYITYTPNFYYQTKFYINDANS